MRMIQQSRIKSWEPFVFFDKEFSPQECETIIHLAKCIPPEAAKTGSNENPQENPSIRSAELHWMREATAHDWIYDRLENVCQKVKAGWYPFQLSGFAEPIQLTRYFASEGGHYDWHQDFGPDAMSTRKLSLIVLLSDIDSFEGGELEMMGTHGADKKVKKLTQGTVIAFPSWEFHRVLKITQGERWSLVCWVHGHPFI